MGRGMTQAEFKALLLETLFRPREAARALIGFGLPQQILWMALVLMSVLNAIVYSVSLRLAPPMDPTAPTLMSSRSMRSFGSAACSGERRQCRMFWC